MFSDFAKFFISLNDFHSNILDAFNGYREYLFSKNLVVQDMIVSDYLNYKLNISYNHITEQKKK